MEALEGTLYRLSGERVVLSTYASDLTIFTRLRQTWSVLYRCIYSLSLFLLMQAKAEGKDIMDLLPPQEIDCPICHLYDGGSYIGLWRHINKVTGFYLLST